MATFRHTRVALGFGTAVLVSHATLAYAQTDGGVSTDPRVGCPSGAVACASAPISYDHREGIPVEFDIDTGWQPPNSDLQVRFHTELDGHTEVAAQGTLQASWPEAMTLRALGTPGTGRFTIDYGVYFELLARIHIATPVGTYDWEGPIPNVPDINFGTNDTATFDPWAWDGVSVMGMTARQHIYDLPLTSSIIPIPGISGGISFDADAVLEATYHSIDIRFGDDANPLTANVDSVVGFFQGGSLAIYKPQLEGHVDYNGTVNIYPGLYVSVAGIRREIDPIAIPVMFGPFGADWQFEPSVATLHVPDVREHSIVVDFGEVPLGERSTQSLVLDSVGDVPLWIAPGTVADPYSFAPGERTIPAHSATSIDVTFEPTSLGFTERYMAIQTDDPDTPTVNVTFRGIGGPANVVDAGVSDAGDGGTPLTGEQARGCGCRTAGTGTRGAIAPWVLASIAGLASRRRRRSGLR